MTEFSSVRVQVILPRALRMILNSFGEKSYRHGNGSLYFLMEMLGNRTSKDRKFLETIDFKGKTVYNIGAYIGLLTTFFAKKVGREGRVIAFEPNPESFSQLLVNTKKFSNIDYFNLGAGSKCEKATLIASTSSRATSTVERRMKLERATHPYRKWSIQVIRLDSLQGVPPPDFVKIDVEGFEYSVLRGMKISILSHRPTLFIEIHGVTTAMKRENMQKIANFLHNLDYELFSVEMHKKATSTFLPLTGHVLAYQRGACRDIKS